MRNDNYFYRQKVNIRINIKIRITIREKSNRSTYNAISEQKNKECIGETAYKVYICSSATLYADLLNNRPEVTLKGHTGALIYLLYN